VMGKLREVPPRGHEFATEGDKLKSTMWVFLGGERGLEKIEAGRSGGQLPLHHIIGRTWGKQGRRGYRIRGPEG